ncbi:MAG: endonuclease/exonuclease/phosphatase family protein [Sphingobacteriia bacterium]|nr:endonuclease/exonuclease/phosphatase family protein [Sphingobacteriia bacterium]
MNGSRFLILAQRVLLIGGIIYSLLFLISCFSANINPDTFYPATYFAICFPVLLGGIIFWCFIALYFFKKQSWIFFLLLLPAINNIRTGIGFNIGNSSEPAKKTHQIRVLSWNVNEFVYGHYSDTEWETKQKSMMQFIRESNADMLCFQDFVPVPYNNDINVQKYITDSLHYPYFYFSMDGINYGTIIFSRIPIKDSGRVKYKEKVYPESLAWADVNVQGKPFRVYNTHLRSMYLHQSVITPATIGYLEFVKEDTGFLFHSTRLDRLAYFDRIHSTQAKLIKEQLNKTTVPYVFCADLNAVPASYTYNLLKKDMKDAFLEKGMGLGGTYHRFSPTLRIDVMLTGETIQTERYYSPSLKLSDHYPILTDLHLGN